MYSVRMIICIYKSSSYVHTCTCTCNIYIYIYMYMYMQYIYIYIYMIKSCTCICKGRQDKVRHSLKADSEKNTELPRTGHVRVEVLPTVVVTVSPQVAADDRPARPGHQVDQEHGEGKGSTHVHVCTYVHYLNHTCTYVHKY